MTATSLISILRRPACVVFWMLLFKISAPAQSNQVWPEVSTFVKLTDQTRFYFIATTVKENHDSIEGEFGPNFDFFLKSLRKKGTWGVFRLDESRNRLITLRFGYRYIYPYSGDSSDEHRGIVEATGRHPLAIGLVVSDRSRLDLRSIEGEFSWRYRNRLTMEREIMIGRFKFCPYGRGEIYYDSRHDKWSRNALIAGSTFPINRKMELEGYFEHQNDSGGSSNRTVNAVGVVVNLYF